MLDEEEEPLVADADDALDEIGDPELEAIEERIIERTPGWKIGGAVVAALVIGGGAVFGYVMRSAISTLPRLKDADIAELNAQIDAADELPAHRRRAHVGRALAEIEHGRLPQPLLGAMVDGGRQTEHTRLGMLRAALVDPEVRPLWDTLCPASFDLEAIADEDRSGERVFQRCGLHRVKLMTASPVMMARASEVLAAHAIFAHLEDHDALTDVEIRALRAFAR